VKHTQLFPGIHSLNNSSNNRPDQSMQPLLLLTSNSMSEPLILVV
jgi:hypothetical protein